MVGVTRAAFSCTRCGPSWRVGWASSRSRLSRASLPAGPRDFVSPVLNSCRAPLPGCLKRSAYSPTLHFFRLSFRGCRCGSLGPRVCLVLPDACRHRALLPLLAHWPGSVWGCSLNVFSPAAWRSCPCNLPRLHILGRFGISRLLLRACPFPFRAHASRLFAQSAASYPLLLRCWPFHSA